VKAIADNIRKGTASKPWRIEGYEQLNWVLLDYVDVVVHIFKSIEREYYQLERLWADAELTEYND
jgi:ribosome-associated protein|tara:strand:- start:25 stop:219 length:195 start_codon:yes stop_codon:yes gene_type:complete